MNNVVIARLLAIIALFLCKMYFQLTGFVLFVSLLALSHYLLGFFYSWKNVKDVFSFNPLLTMATFALAIATIFWKFPSIIIFFGIHHVLTEYYLTKDEKQTTFSIVRILVLSISYFFMVKKTAFGGFGDFVAVAIFLYAVAIAYMGIKKSISKTTALNEGITVLLFFVFYLTSYGFMEIVGYHFFVWLFLPYLKMPAQKAKLKYTAQTLVSFIILALFGLYMIQYQSYNPFRLGMLGTRWMILIGYFHITISFILSKHNPDFILKFAGQRK